MTCINLPIVVASQSFTGYTEAIPATSLYSPSEDGNFLVCIYLRPESFSNSNHVTVSSYISWNDGTREIGGYPATQNVNGSGANGFLLGGSLFIHASSGSSIQISTALDQTGDPPTPYDLFVVVLKF